MYTEIYCTKARHTYILFLSALTTTERITSELTNVTGNDERKGTWLESFYSRCLFLKYSRELFIRAVVDPYQL